MQAPQVRAGRAQPMQQNTNATQPMVQPSRKPGRVQLTVPRDTPPAQMYAFALHFARAEEYAASRVLFERLLKKDSKMCKAWVSYAMMEKRCAASSPTERFERCRVILQRGLLQNPTAACLVQAWGLMELQRGNLLAALMLLERSVAIDPKLQPVLNWTQVDMARKTVGSRRQRKVTIVSATTDVLSDTSLTTKSSAESNTCSSC